MDFNELLKKYFDDETKITEFLDDMKSNKLYLSNEENIDIRYSKLKGELDSLTEKDKEAQALIDELKKNSGDAEKAQAQIAEYEAKIDELEKRNTELTIDNAVKFGLLAKGAKSSDIDYLIYRAKNGDTELKLDKEGNVKGLDELIDSLKKNYSSNFEEKEKKKVDVKDLPEAKGDENKITQEQFQKMSYAERNKLFKENKEQYELLRKGEVE